MPLFPRASILSVLALWPGMPQAFAAHTGATDVPGIEPSDIALFLLAVLGVWLARRSMRARARARRPRED